MEKLLSKFQDLDSQLSSLQRFCKENNFDANILTGFNTEKIRNIYSRLLKHYKEHPQKAKNLWFQSELKLFNWILISYAFVNYKKIQDFTLQDWSCFKDIFYEKDVNTFKYETQKLLNQNSKHQRAWNTKEEQILQSIMRDQVIKNKWNQVGRKFFQLSGQKQFRTGKQCRQHWQNHLDLTKRHGKWTCEQDIIMLKFVMEYGKKWSIAHKNILPHRTQHLIQNRYKSLITKHKKKMAVGDQNQQCMTQKILAFYGKKQIGETSILKATPNPIRIKHINPSQKSILQKSINVQNQNLNKIQNLDKVDVMSSEKKFSNFRKVPQVDNYYPPNITWSAQYCINPVAIQFYCPVHYPVDNYWSQIN